MWMLEVKNQVIFVISLGILLQLTTVHSQQKRYYVSKDAYCTLEKVDKYCGMHATLVLFYNAEAPLGYLYYVYLPFRLCVIYNFFIEHLYRHQGYGSLLLQFICDYLQTQHVKRIIIQPGPFDYEQNMYQSFTGDEYQQRLQSLVQFYTKLGFTKAPRWMRLGAKLLYPLLGIHENPSYLLMK